MKNHRVSFGLTAARLTLAAGMLLAAVPSSATAASASEDVVGHRMPNFILKDHTGKDRSLAEFASYEAVVVVMMGTTCPIGNRYLPVLEELQQRYRDQARVLLVYPNAADTQQKIADHVAKFKITVPALQDADQRVLQAAGAARLAEAYVLDHRRVIRYHGRIDDRFGYDHQRDTATRNDLETALGEVLEHKQVSVNTTPIEGCLVTSIRPQPPAGQITFHKQVSRILQNKCQSCHHSGAVGPMSLIEADDVAGSAAMIKQVVLERRMPPWHADPRFGKFRNDRSLSSEELDTLVNWVDAGAPLGDKKDAPEPREFVEGWTIGKPDMVFELPKEVTVKATGTVPYMYFETPTNFEEDVWIQAAEARPGNRAVVHHVVVLYRMPGDPKGQIAEQWVCGTAPGDLSLVLPPGTARRIPKGAILIWQMHYTPTGKEEVDRSQMALIRYKGPQPPEHYAHTHGIGNRFFKIPPGEANHRVSSSYTLPRDVRLLGFMPHMHLRGKNFEYQALYPDGRSEILLSVPRYDFSWQSTYRLSEALNLPKGTRLQCVAHFDNSPENPANPDPTQTVSWGDQTWEEMMTGYVDYTWAESETKPAVDQTSATK